MGRGQDPVFPTSLRVTSAGPFGDPDPLSRVPMDANPLPSLARRLDRLRDGLAAERERLAETERGIEPLRRRVLALEALEAEDPDPREVREIAEHVERLESRVPGAAREPGVAAGPSADRRRSERRSGLDRRKLPGGPL